MKISLEFNLPGEQDDYWSHISGPKLRRVFEDFDGWLRDLTKYQGQETIRTLEVREKLWSIHNEWFNE